MSDDPDNPEWTEEDFRRARPAHEVHPPAVVAALTRKTSHGSLLRSAFATAAPWLTHEKLAA